MGYKVLVEGIDRGYFVVRTIFYAFQGSQVSLTKRNIEGQQNTSTSPNVHQSI